MTYLVTILLSFYPSFFIYASMPQEWMRWIDGLAPDGRGFFLVHLALFVLIFSFSYVVISKFVSLGYGSRAHRSPMGTMLLLVFIAALGVIAFYNVLPGNMVFESHSFLDNYLLKNPYLFIAGVLPLGYLFFD